MTEKVLMLGSNGQVGTALQKTAPIDFEVHAIGRDSVDLTHEDSLRSCIQHIRPTLIINAAAHTAVDKAESESELAFAINAKAPQIMGQEAARLGAKLVQYSTDYVFDGAASIPYVPSHEKNPLSVYGKSKSLGEDNLLSEMPSENLLVLRTAWVYQSGGKNFVATMLRLMQSRSTLRIVSDQLGTPTSATSIAQATWAAVHRSVFGVHHFTDAGVASWYDFACQIERLGRRLGTLEKPIEIIPISTAEYPQAAVRPKFSVLDKNSFWTAAQIKPRHWVECLQDEFSA